MIQTNELRIGNWINEFEIATQADSRFIDRLYNIELRGKIAIDVTPIPLTPEILEKAGFNEVDGNEWYRFYDKGFLRVFIHHSVDSCFVSVDGLKIDYYINNFYLHQLQNLYFALTGEELNIEL